MKFEDKNFFIVGAGKVGSALCMLLKNNKVKIAGILDTDEKKGQKLAKKIGSKFFPDFSGEIKYDLDVIFIAVPDDALPEIVETIAKKNVIKPGTVVCHTSGVNSANILDPLKKLGAVTFSIHPLLSINEPDSLLDMVEETYFALEGDSKGIEFGINLVDLFGARYFTIDADKKPLYHAAACILSNSMTTLFGLSTSILLDIGIDTDDAYEGLCTLLGSTFLNLAKSEPAKSLTGPVSRGDLETVKIHLEALSDYDEGIKDLYTQIGKFTVEFAEIIGCDKGKIEKIKREFDVEND